MKIITDSTSYIGKELLEKYGIEVLPLKIQFNDISFKENEISNEVFYPLMAEKGIPTSSQPSLGDMEKAFTDAIADGSEAIGIFLSSKMSGTYSTALLIKNTILEKNPLAKINIIDSMSNSMQLGFAVLTAAKATLEGLSLENITELVINNIKRSRFLFIPHNLKYLEKGGRIGMAGALLGNLLKIIPILTVEDGVTHMYKKVRTKQRAIEDMITKMMEDVKNFGGLSDIIVHHINCLDEALKLTERLKALLGIDDIAIHDIGPVIGLHVGPGAIGIVYCTKEELR